MSVQMADQTRYLRGQTCPRDPQRQHAIAVRISSSVPTVVITPTLTDADVEWHWCPPEENR